MQCEMRQEWNYTVVSPIRLYLYPLQAIYENHGNWNDPVKTAEPPWAYCELSGDLGIRIKKGGGKGDCSVYNS